MRKVISVEGSMTSFQLGVVVGGGGGILDHSYLTTRRFPTHPIIILALSVLRLRPTETGKINLPSLKKCCF